MGLKEHEFLSNYNNHFCLYVHVEKMSFNIENILKMNSNNCKNEKKINFVGGVQNLDVSVDNYATSILHHTLVNKVDLPCCRSISEYQNLSFSSNFENCRNFEHAIYSTDYPYYYDLYGKCYFIL